ncbi:MAG TPA: hypothetical protein EYP04_12185, partial [Anaerolineae bacterium]|nr:hypothetical protein [Anaerolineae bacterium]
MTRTRVVFIAVILLALVIVGAALAWRALNAPQGPPLTVKAKGPIHVRVLTALPVEPWVREAAKAFNKEDHKLEGEPIEVEVVAMDGLTALGKWDRDEFGTLTPEQVEQLRAGTIEPPADFPTVWIPDSLYLVELANAAYKERLGRDVFLTDGEYRARRIAISLFAWGIYQSRAEVLKAKYGDLDWQVIHDAAVAKGGWPELGGKPEWGFFKLVVPNPRKNVGGLAAMIAAAGEYYDRPDISTADVTDPKFQAWLGEVMSAVTDLSGASAYTAEDFALFGYSVGDGGQLLESDLLNNMQGILTRWGEPLEIFYPKYITWFDFPFTVWVGPETSALQKNAALEFEKYLLSEEVQRQAVVRGLRPVNPNVSVAEGENPFTRWQAQGV